MKKLLWLIPILILISIYLCIISLSRKIGLSVGQIYNLAVDVKNYPNPAQPTYKFILLGLDPRQDQLEVTQTTDTIVLVSLNFDTGHLNLISLPRDLWWSGTKTKINYFYPLYQGQKDQLILVKNEYEKLTNQSIDDIFIITTDSLRQLVTLIGGVDVYLAKGFTDSQYPNPAYIASPSANIPIYQTVTFPSGQIHLDNSNITEFVRSRKSSDLISDGGTDIGRSQRQQLVIEAILTKIKSPAFKPSFSFVNQLYRWWQSQSTTITLPKIIRYSLFNKDLLSKISLSKISLPLKEVDPKNGIIYHPNYFLERQWVYLPTSSDYRSLRQFIQDNI